MQQASLDALSMGDADDMAACRAHLRDGSRTFYAASFLLPRQVREPASALYAFCRLADDAVDLKGGSFAAIAALRRSARSGVCGRYQSTVRSTGRSPARFCSSSMPRELPDALLDGLAWDAEGRRYEQLSDLTAYAARVAGAVGAMMAVIMGARESASRRQGHGSRRRHATHQYRSGRGRRRTGGPHLPAACVAAERRHRSRCLARSIRRQRRRSPASSGICSMRRTSCTSAPNAASPVCRALAARAYALRVCSTPKSATSCGVRIWIPSRVARSCRRRVKLRKLARAASALPLERSGAQAPSLDETRFLADAVARSSRPEPPASQLRWWDLHGQAVWVIALFEQLQRRGARTAGAHLSALDPGRAQVRQ